MRKFKTGDNIRVIENGLLGQIMGISFNSFYQCEDYIIEWAHSPGKHETYPVDECDSIWALEPCPVVNVFMKSTQGIPSIDVKVKIEEVSVSCNGYNHTWVDVGFHFTKEICKYCNVEKGRA